MFGIGKKKDIVDSVEKLTDPRAREIAELYKVDINSLLASYQALENRVIAGGGQIEIDPDISAKDKSELLAQIASGAVISYELTKQKELRLSYSETLKRTAPTGAYEQIGNVYNSLLKSISQF